MPVSKNKPYWLELSPDEEYYLPNDDLVGEVQEIFRLYLNGASTVDIAERLKGKPLETRAKARNWTTGRISEILRDRSVIGERTTKKGRVTERGYFPEIIAKSDFEQVQTILSMPSALGQDKAGNLFRQLCFCECGEPVKTVLRGPDDWLLRCRTCEDAPEVPLGWIELFLFTAVLADAGHDLSKPRPLARPEPYLAKQQRELAYLSVNLRTIGQPELEEQLSKIGREVDALRGAPLTTTEPFTTRVGPAVSHAQFEKFADGERLTSEQRNAIHRRVRQFGTRITLRKTNPGLDLPNGTLLRLFEVSGGLVPMILRDSHLGDLGAAFPGTTALFVAVELDPDRPYMRLYPIRTAK